MQEKLPNQGYQPHDSHNILSAESLGRTDNTPDGPLENYMPEYGLQVALSEDERVISEALELEQKIWNDNDFGDLAEYAVFNNQSRVFTADIDGEVIGVTRVFYGAPEPPPFTKLPMGNEEVRRKILERCESLEMEELGTTAVDKSRDPTPKHTISLQMWRLAYRDAIRRDVKYWGIIMEPERVQKMNDSFGFTFEQLGPTEYYQGGDCAAFAMDLRVVDEYMREKLPDLYEWFVREPLSDLAESK